MRRLFFILLAVAIPATSGAQDPARPELPDDARVTLHEALEGSRSYKARIQAAIGEGRRSNAYERYLRIGDGFLDIRSGRKALLLDHLRDKVV